jgi:hypothetical protein
VPGVSKWRREAEALGALKGRSSPARASRGLGLNHIRNDDSSHRSRSGHEMAIEALENATESLLARIGWGSSWTNASRKTFLITARR